MARTYLASLGIGALVVAMGCSTPGGSAGGTVQVYYDLAGTQPTDTAVAAEDVAPPDDTSAGAGTCTPCVANEECGSGFRCAQAAESSYCLAECGDGLPACQASELCSLVSDTAGQQAQVCASTVQTCSGDPVEVADAGATEPPDSGPSASTCPGYADPATPSCCVCGAGKTCATNGCYNGWLCNLSSCKCNPAPDTCDSPDTTAPSDTSAGLPPTCGALDGPSVASCCTCKAGMTCAANHCYGGWYCNHDSCGCQPPPSPSQCGTGSDASSGPDLPDTTAPDTAPSDPGDNVVDNSGGVLSSLDFAMVGDTRPPVPNSIALYPTAIISKIWQGVESEVPHLPFAITTGDYQFSTTKSTSGAPQFDLYLAAQKAFTSKVFYTLGNHECTGATASNCGPGNANGITNTYLAFQQKLLAAIGQTLPYYTLNFKHKGGKWTAKFVIVAANAWDATQAAWLEAELAKPTNYTFVVRHEGDLTVEAPGVAPSGALLKKYPLTLLLAGHTHTYKYIANSKEVILGNGGAPLATTINYGYGVMRQHADGNLEFNVYDYASHAVLGHFVVKPNGSPAP